MAVRGDLLQLFGGLGAGVLMRFRLAPLASPRSGRLRRRPPQAARRVEPVKRLPGRVTRHTCPSARMTKIACLVRELPSGVHAWLKAMRLPFGDQAGFLSSAQVPLMHVALERFCRCVAFRRMRKICQYPSSLRRM
jgi:hypothetical protein